MTQAYSKDCVTSQKSFCEGGYQLVCFLYFVLAYCTARLSRRQQFVRDSSFKLTLGFAAFLSHLCYKRKSVRVAQDTEIFFMSQATQASNNLLSRLTLRKIKYQNENVSGSKIKRPLSPCHDAKPTSMYVEIFVTA